MDETTFKYDPNPPQQKVRYKGDNTLRPECLKPSFKSQRTTVNYWGGIQVSGRTELV